MKWRIEDASAKVGERSVFFRDLTNGLGEVVRVRVELDLGGALEREILRLANRVRSSKTQKVASSAGMVVRVSIDRPCKRFAFQGDVPGCPEHGT